MSKLKVSNAPKHKENPFLENDVITIDKGRKQIIVGSSNKVLVDKDTGETEGITLMHKYKEVDKEQFVKLFIHEVQSLFDLTKTGLRVFGYVLQCLRINDATIYINISDLMDYCGYKTTKAVYKGLAELINSNIIALSEKPNLWHINPKIVFNGDRIAFVKEYRLKKSPKPLEQTKLKL